MNTATFQPNDFGPFLAIHDFIDRQRITPTAKRLWGAMYGFFREHGSVYICRAFFAEKLSVQKSAITRALNELEGIGAAHRTGEFKFGFFPCVELQALPEPLKVTAPVNSEPVIKRSPLGDHSGTKRRSFDHTQKNKEEQIKEQTVVLSKKEFSSNEKIALKQKLKAIGIFKQSINKLTAKYSVEHIENQIKHLEHLLEQGKNIEKPASWLMKAIEQNFPLPETINPSALKKADQEEDLRKASILAQDAKFKLDEGNLGEAKDLATKSLQVAQNSLAQKTLQEINDTNEKTHKIKEARAKLSNEQFLLMRQEEEQKQLIKMRKFGKSGAEFMSSVFFKNLVDAVVDQRLLAGV